MAQMATEARLKAVLAGLREQTYQSVCSSTGELISALQARELEKAQQIAAELQQDLQLCDQDRPRYYLAQIMTLLYVEDVFLHCDELSVWLLVLESELNRLRHSCSEILPSTAVAASTLPVLFWEGCNTQYSKLSKQGRPVGGTEY